LVNCLESFSEQCCWHMASNVFLFMRPFGQSFYEYLENELEDNGWCKLVVTKVKLVLIRHLPSFIPIM
jgi:hypothetical protein